MGYINRTELLRRMNVGDVYVILTRSKYDFKNWQQSVARYNKLRTGHRISIEHIDQYAKITKFEDPYMIDAKIW